MAAKSKLTEVVPKLVALLGRVEAAERGRAIQAALLTLGGESIALPAGGAGGGGGGGGNNFGGAGAGAGAGAAATPQAYFKAKDPKSKIEELAVAARYREVYASAETSSKSDIQDIVTRARRNFDASNFNRDIFNARTAKLFNTGGDKDAHMLSDYGQDYVDALPDRTALKQLSPAKRRRPGNKKAAKAKK